MGGHRRGRLDERVHAGAEGELFLATNNILEIAFGKRPPKERDLDVFRRNIGSRRRFCAEAGIGYLHLVCPDKHNVYSHQLDEPVTFCLAEFFRERTATEFLYPRDFLKGFLPERVYRRTDTHWTSFATAQVCALLAECLGLSPARVRAGLDSMLASIGPDTDEQAGDLGAKLLPPELEPVPVVRPGWDRLTLTNNLETGNDGQVVLVLSGHDRARGRLVIFGDSYMRDSLDFLSAYFREILFCRTRFFHAEIVSQAQPDYVITENAERYLGHVRPDSEAPPCLMIAPLQGRRTEYSVGFAAALSHFLNPGIADFGKLLHESTGWRLPEDAEEGTPGGPAPPGREGLPGRMRLFRSIQESGRLDDILGALASRGGTARAEDGLRDLLGGMEPDADPAEGAILSGLVAPGAVCLDAGAGAGAYSLLLGQRVGTGGRIHAFEASPLERAVLQRRIEVAGASQVTVEPSLVSNRSTAPAGSLAGPDDRTASPGLVSVDDYVARHRIDRLALLRLGGGVPVELALQGAFNTIARLRPYIVLPLTHRAGDDPKRTERPLNMLRMAGYTVCAIHPRPWPHVRLLAKPDLSQPFRATLFCYHGPRNDAHA